MKWFSALAAVAGMFAAMVQGESAPAQAPRAIAQHAGLPGIDRGLRAQDPPRAARTAADAQITKQGVNRRPFLSGSIVVKYKNDPDAFDLVAIPSNADPEVVAAAMRQRAEVEYAQPRYINYAMARPNDPMYANQWNFPAIDMERAWDIQPGATRDIVVAVLDSGMAYRTLTLRYESTEPFQLTPNGPFYPPLGTVEVPFAAAPELGASGSERFVAPRDFIWNDDVPVDLDGHGTHVAGTIGQLTNNGTGVAGMAYNVRLMPVKIIDGVWD
jgi:subtilisin family serine protease